MSIFSHTRNHKHEHKHTLFAVAALTIGLGLAGCSAGADTDNSAAITTGSPISVTTLQGDSLQIPATGKPTAAFFFSTGCSTCYTGGKGISAAQQQVGDEAEFVAVSIDPGDTEPSITGFIQAVGGQNLAIARDSDRALMSKYDVKALGTLLVIDSNGEVTYRGQDPDGATISAELGQAV